MVDLFNFERGRTSVTHVGALNIGRENPVRVRSMTTASTDDTEGSVAQAKRIIDTGGEPVRLTTQGKHEAENLRNINARLRADNYMALLCADVHFSANVADVAALYAERVRINPGNYVDPARTFKELEYTDEEYTQELQKIENRLIPFINIYKENHTAIRIDVNHGNLSGRIRNRYDDTPEGIVESCMEFLYIFRKYDFHDIIISIKSSNTVVMVHPIHLLVAEMDKGGMQCPLHFGVAGAGEGEDRRIRSAVGIGALLADGLDDTIHVSLNEEPECETPVVKHLTWYIHRHEKHLLIPARQYTDSDYLHPSRHEIVAADNIGGENVPVVIATRKADQITAKVSSPGLPRLDYIYVQGRLPEKRAEKRKYILNYNAYIDIANSGKQSLGNVYPIFSVTGMPFVSMISSDIKFLVLKFGTPSEEFLAYLKTHPEVIVVCMTSHQNHLGDQRTLAHQLMMAGVKNPIILTQMYQHSTTEEREESSNNQQTETTTVKEKSQLETVADMGALMMDELTDGIWLVDSGNLSQEGIEQMTFGILQAGRLRMVKTEYISYPGCDRTLYDLRTTTARIKEATKGMTGLKVRIVGCIVNGPGGMADADYGYVGAGPKKVSLYCKQVCVEHNIPEEEAVERLLALIKAGQNKA